MTICQSNSIMLCLVDPRLKPVAQVTLGKLMATRREVPLHDLSEEEFHVIPVDQDEEDVAYAFNQYHLISAPVVDADGRLGRGDYNRRRDGGSG